MVLQGCKSPQKSRPIESGHGRYAVQVANVCSYKLGLKKLIAILVQTRLVFAWTVTRINIYLDHVIYHDVGILETSALTRAGGYSCTWKPLSTHKVRIS